ncbi:phage tail tip lysozyme [Ensifer sp. LC163]|uniref:phage tail tip lysozyme n=1 Tax=Ensifer sp. LC163 TaxID=1120652 RepID=UPI00081393CE|nr:phage tail tip lysozyme [Ensifer sp. LC163]OCP36733.1 hypothetical protein BC360_05090 [Ensifer sp. LC163]
MVGYLFGGNTGETPETLKRKRELAMAIMGAQGAPKTVGEGLTALGAGITAGFMNRRADKAEREGRASADSLFSSGLRGQLASKIMGSPPSSGSGGGSVAAGPVTTSGDVYSPFMDTVRGGVTNPYGLAAVASTANAESRFSPQNANRAWSDPSESGKAGTAGGIMSWRDDRLNNLYSFAGKKGEKQGAISPTTQAEFFLQENPALITALNNAKSVEEAQQLMNNAWKFAGYNRPGGEAANRMASANAYLPSFQGQQQPREVASLDPSIGMPNTAAGAVTAMGQGGSLQPVNSQTMAGAGSGAIASASPFAPQSLSDEVAAYERTPEYAARFPGQEQANQPEAQPGPVQVAQAQPPLDEGPDPATLYQILTHPFSSPEQKATAQMMLEERQWRQRQDYEQRLKQSDPNYQMDLDYRRAQIEKLNREAETGGENFFGNPVAVQNEDGSIAYGQIGNKGTFRPIKLGEGQSFAPPTRTVDTGTETILMDQAGNVISRTPKQNREAERDKAIGSGEGKVQAEKQAEYDSITSKMPGLYSVVDRLSQLAEGATYTMAGRALDYGIGQLGMEPRDAAVARAEYTAIVDNQILPLLRDTFGAQFTNEEGLRLARTLGDADKSPTEKSALLRAFIQQKERDIQALGTQIGKGAGQPDVQRPSPNAAARSSDQAPAGVDPEDWKYMTPEERKLFQ